MNPKARPVALWLASVCLLIVGMVVVGGITRLTGSGLSITEWKPIMGALPPLDAAAWEAAFARYRAIPQYQLLHATPGQEMTLAEFKGIFFWEYLHRLLGRAIGLVYLLPGLWLAWRGLVPRPLYPKLAFGFLLGGLQGALGWFMVMSGLQDRVYVSHYRLAAHLGLALFLLAYLFWTWLGLVRAPHPAAATRLRRGLRWLTGLIALQIFYGALLAGLKAGFGYNTFPTMNGEWFPVDFFRLEPAWRNLFDGNAAVQFIHRVLGTLLLLATAVYWLRARKQASSELGRALGVLALLITLQFALGVSTLVLEVPIALAALHQLTACAVLLAAIWANFEASPSASSLGA